jgi:LysM repeat protein
MMQTDVKSAHIMAGTSGLVFAGRTRLKGAVVSNTQSGTPANILFVNNVSLTATYSITTTTVTVTVAAGHGLATGARVFLDYTSGNGTDNIYTITVTGVTTFTATVPSSSGTGNVLVYAQTLMEIDITNSVPVNVIVPGEGIVANDGIYVGVPANIAATVFYG